MVIKKSRIYLTIDTESSMGGAWHNPSLRPLPANKRVFCRIRGRDYGIGWQCEQLRQRGLRATFFCEVLSSLVLGEDDTRSYLEFLLEQGQDVQLHVHPNFYHYAEKLWADANQLDYTPPPRPDTLSSFTTEKQAEILHLASEIFRYLTGRAPAAFRAGSYQADERTLTILAQLGLRIDSSYNPAYRSAGSFTNEALPANRPVRLNGILEVPVTVVRQQLPLPGKPGGLMPLEICALSSAEMRAALDRLHASGTRHVVIVHHSFACVKARDVQYREMKPDRVVMRRFISLLDYLAENSDRFEVTTMDALARHEDEALPGQAVVPSLGYLPPLLRTVQQAVNRLYIV